MVSESEDFRFASLEVSRTLDERFRVQVPSSFCEVLNSTATIFAVTEGQLYAQARREAVRAATQSSEQAEGVVVEVSCTLAKERTGCLSLWDHSAWANKLERDMLVIRGKVQSRKLDARFEQVQRLGRLLSTRGTTVDLTFKGTQGARLLIPKGFREFLGVEPNAPVMIVASAYSIEIWNPVAWGDYLNSTIPEFHKLLDDLTQ